MDDAGVQRRTRLRVTAAATERADDAVAVERALELRVGGRALVVTLRTPGADTELALGFLSSEGLVRSRTDVVSLTAHASGCAEEPDVLEVVLAPGVTLDWTRLERHFASTSACGLCGRAHVESLRAGLGALPAGAPIARAGLLALGGRLAASQPGFAATGGLHAAAWCDARLEPVLVREDVGRHNAVDKVCGALLERGRRPVGEGVLWVSGRAGAELVLKAVRAGVPAMVAVGAPTSLAIDLAQAAGLLLAGFAREGRMNVYAGEARLGA